MRMPTFNQVCKIVGNSITIINHFMKIQYQEPFAKTATTRSIIVFLTWYITSSFATWEFSFSSGFSMRILIIIAIAIGSLWALAYRDIQW